MNVNVPLPSFWTVIPPWLYAVVVTLLGRWGARLWLRRGSIGQPSDGGILDHLGAAMLANLVFLSLLPMLVLLSTGPMLPLSGARAGLALGMAAYLFGCVPTRLLDVGLHGWDRSLWNLLVDLLRVGGACLLVGWLALPDV
ncbi:MAG TPA: hypothetical protein VGB22_02590 [candidate division Zixibacteria bacterium]|jgi:hypothetical protein